MNKLWSSERPLVTGAMLCYNKLDFVQRSALSVVQNAGLDHEDFDFRLWDQGSPYPGVQEWLQDIAKHPWPKVEGCGFNIGVGAALNQVIETSDSEYFFKIDDDTALFPLTLPLMLLAYEIAMRSGFPLAVLSADVLGVGKYAGELYEVEVAPGVVIECAPCVGGGAVLIKREVLEDVGPFRADRLYGVEDGDFAARAMQKGYHNGYLKGAYHMSYCRGEEADPEIDRWKLSYYGNETDLEFPDWLKEQGEQ